jgi:hypothetical protein
MSKALPAIFFGHGNPMNAIQHNSYTEAWSAIGRLRPLRERSTISAVFRKRYFRCSILLRGTLCWPLECNGCWRLYPWRKTVIGVWITVRGPCYATSIPKPISP